MPKRTNEFQRLVAQIQKSLGGKGTTIRESVMEAGPCDDNLREIDILLEGTLGSYNIRVAVEAKDEKRPFSLERFESLLHKYKGPCGPRVDKIVVVTRRGFTKSVWKLAERERVTLYTLDEAQDVDWSKHKNFGISIEFPPHFAGVRFFSADSEVKLDLKSAAVVCTCCDREHGTAWQYAQKVTGRILRDKGKTLSEEMKKRASAAPNGVSIARLEISIPGMHARTSSGNVDLVSMTLFLRLQLLSANFRPKVYDLKGADGSVRKYQHFEGQSGGSDVTYFSEGDGIHNMHLSFRPTVLKKTNGRLSPASSNQPRNAKCECGSGKVFKKCCGAPK